MQRVKTQRARDRIRRRVSEEPLSATTTTSDAGGLGIGLPIVLACSLLAAIAFVLIRRHRSHQAEKL